MMENSKILSIRQFTRKAVVFYGAALLVLSGLRLFFLMHFGGADVLAHADVPDALWMGMRVDAKWLSICLAPAWVFWMIGLFFGKVQKPAKVLAVIGWLPLAVLGVINIGFYTFYATPISSIIFGFLQDDTTAVVKTLWQDWPVLSYVAGLSAVILLPVLLAAAAGRRPARKPVGKAAGALLIVLSLIFFVGTMRGSLGKFPLRQQNWAVSTNPFLNASVPNGAASFYEAYREQKGLVFKGGAQEALRQLGFGSLENAQAVLSDRCVTQTQEARLENAPEFVVLAVMESMGRDEFDSHNRETNNTLGQLEDVLPQAVVFRQGIAVGGGTFPSLEGLLFNTPVTPISQSRYGRQDFPFSRVLRYRRAGYKTVFISSGTSAWRGINETFPLHGFDEVWGAVAIAKTFPKATIGTWGVEDEWMFKFAARRMEQAAQNHERLMVVLLSATNHPPHVVPQGYALKPVNPQALPAYIVTDRQGDLFRGMLQTYQYSSNALGMFVKTLEKDRLSDKTLLVATGDHNARFKYVPNGYWHHGNGVPIIFWLPESKKNFPVDLKRWVSHRDIFPTLNALVFGDKPKAFEGRALFAKDSLEMAQSFATMGKYGFSIGKAGAVALNGADRVSCFKWQGDELLPAPCEGDLKAMAQKARAQRALSEYEIRHGVLK